MAIEEDPDPGVPEWVVTFGDMMSLLLTFFIMLVAMSEVKKEEQYHAMVESMRKRFGHELSIASVMPGRDKPRNSRLMKLATMGRARRADIMRGGAKVNAPVGDNPRVQSPRRGDDFQLGGVVFFEEDTARLTDEDKRRLQAIAGKIGGKPQKIEIRGHSSRKPLPKNSSYRDHWHLAYDRCHRVMQYLVKLGIEPQRIRLAVAAEYEPIYLGIDPVERAKNARVEVLLLNERVEDLEAAPPSEATSIPDR
jgi:chemotaxis protein MotB